MFQNHLSSRSTVDNNFANKSPLRYLQVIFRQREARRDHAPGVTVLHVRTDTAEVPAADRDTAFR